MPPDLRERLERECGISGRSLNAEVVARLRASLEFPAPYGGNGHTLQDPGGAYNQSCNNTVALTDPERQLLAQYARLPVDKQLALLTFLK
jgi:hypothetical protein